MWMWRTWLTIVLLLAFLGELIRGRARAVTALSLSDCREPTTPLGFDMICMSGGDAQLTERRGTKSGNRLGKIDIGSISEAVNIYLPVFLIAPKIGMFSFLAKVLKCPSAKTPPSSQLDSRMMGETVASPHGTARNKTDDGRRELPDMMSSKMF